MCSNQATDLIDLIFYFLGLNTCWISFLYVTSAAICIYLLEVISESLFQVIQGGEV